MGHVTKNGHLGHWIYAFHMPLFFLLSGVFFKPSLENWKKSSKRLLGPYLCFAIVSFVYWRFAEMRFRPLPEGFDANMHALDILWQTQQFRFNVPLWFLPCLMVVQSVGCVIFSVVKRTKVSLLVIIAWIAIASLLQMDIHSMWIKQTLYAFPFFGIGYLTGKDRFTIAEDFIKTYYSKYAIVAILPLIALWFYNCSNDMMGSSYSNGYFTFLAVAVICICCCFALSSLLSNQKWLMWLGTNSLAIMCLHEPLKRILIVVAAKLLHMPNEEVRGSFLLSILLTAVIIALLVPVCMFINKRCKWVLGR